MTQYVINIGALPNDGTGDPLRTAFNEVNLNFDQVFAAGPVLSNIQIANNTILTTNTNGNLVLAPNGIGVVQANVSIVPNTSNIRNLGSADRRWSTVYAQYANVSGGLNVANLIVTGDATVGGNLSVTGNVINIGNIVTDSKTIQLANTAVTANAADESGITVGANDAIATMLYSSIDNAWVMNIGVETPNIFVNNISSIDSTLVTVQDGLDVQGPITAQLFLDVQGSITGQTLSASGNISTAGSMRATTVSAIGSVLAATVSASGNISGSFIAPGGNGQVLYNRSGVIGASPLDFNFDESSYTLYVKVGSFSGNVDGTDALYVGAPGFTFLGSDIMAQFTGNVPSYSQINFQNISNNPQASGDFIVTADNGTDSTHFIDLGITSSTWNGTEINGLGTEVGPDTGYLYVQDGNLAVGTRTGNSVHVWTWTDNGNVLASGNLIPSANVTYSLGNSTNWWSNVWLAGNTMYIGGVPIGMGAGNVLTVAGNAVVTESANGTVDLANLAIDNNNIYNTQGQGVVISNFSFIDEAETAYVQIPAGNSASDLSVVQTQGNVRIATAAADWMFDTTGNLTLPQNGNITSVDGWAARFQATNGGLVQSGITLDPNDGIVRLESFNSPSNQGFTTADWTTGEYVNNGGFGEIVFTDAPTIVNFFATINTSRLFWQVNGGNLLPSAGWGTGGNNITFYTDIPPAASPETVTTFSISYSSRSLIEMDYDEAEMNILSSGLDVNIESDQSIDVITSDIIRLQNRSNTSGVGIITDSANAFHIWNFQPTGNLTLPIQGNIVGSTPNNAGHLQWVGNSSGDGGGYTTLRLVPDDTVESSDQYLIVDPTGGGHIHIRAGGTQDNSNSFLYLGGENSYFQVPAGNNPSVYIAANSNVWNFGNDGTLSTPGGVSVSGLVSATGNVAGANVFTDGLVSAAGNITGNYIIGNGSQLTGLPASYTDANVTTLLSNLGSNVISGTGNITTTANISGAYILGNGSQLTGLPAGYTNSDVANFLAAYGSNTISTSGNITAGNLIGNLNVTGNITGTSANVTLIAGAYSWTFDNTGNFVLPANTFAVNYANGTAVTLGGTYGNAQVADFLDSLGSNAVSTTGNVTAGNVLVSGVLSATGNITGGNLITSGSFQSANIVSTGNITSGNGSHVILGNATSSLRQGGSNSTVNLSGSITLTPDTAASGLNGVIIGGNGYLLAPNGARGLTLAGNNAVTVAGNLTLGGSTSSSRFTTLGDATTGVNAVVAGQSPTILANSSATFTANVNNYTQITFQNKNTGTDATADYILTADNGSDTVNYGDFGIINSGYDNNTPTNSLGNIVFAADTYLYAQGNIGNTNQSGGNLVIGTTVANKYVKIFAGGNTASALIANISNTGISVTGNVTATNFIGNVSLTGNIQGTSANVELVAGSYTWTFDNNGVATFPGNVSVTGNVITPNRPAFRVYGNGVTNVSTTTNTTGVLNGNNWAVDYNQGSYLNSTTGTFTAPVTGLYQVNLNARVANNTGSASQVIVYKNYGAANTVQVMWETAANCTVNHFGVGTVSKLAAGDTLNLVVTVGQLTFDANDSWSVAFLG